MTGSSLTEDEVRRVFSPLETRGGSAEFLKHVSEDVDWTIKGTHPLAGHHFSRKEFQVSIPGYAMQVPSVRHIVWDYGVSIVNHTRILLLLLQQVLGRTFCPNPKRSSRDAGASCLRRMSWQELEQASGSP